MVTANTVSELKTLAQANIKTFITRLHANGMMANIGKSSYTLFYPRRLTPLPRLHFAGQDLKHVTETKTLGIMLRQDLKHDSTINKVLSQLGAAVALMKAAGPLLTLSDLLALYYRHVHSALTYGITLWGHIDPTKGYLKPVLRKQKRIIHHMLTGSHY